MNQARLLLLGLLVLVSSTGAWAHKASDSFIYLDQSGEGTSLRLDLALRDLALVLPLDSNGDRQVTGAELRAARGEITTYVADGMTLSSAAGACLLQGQTWGLARHSDGPYAAASYRVSCPDNAAPARLEYNLLFDVDPLHRALVQQTTATGEQLMVIGPQSPILELGAGATGLLKTFTDFLYQGVVHLVLGYDHVLFLLVLVLPATLVRSGAATQRGTGRRLLELAGIVTAFTVAHSITLGLAALDVVRPPITWVEIIIALSIALAALNLFWPILGHRTWRLAFGFGLIHGFGFASVLGDLTSGTSQTMLALAGFNIGVELGQLALLVLVFPILLWLSRYRFYQKAAVPAMAVMVSAVSLYWVVERAATL